MKKVVVKDRHGSVVISTRALPENSPEFQQAYRREILAAELHNRMRPPGSYGGCGSLTVFVEDAASA